MKVEDIHYSDGSVVRNPVIQIWNDLYEERSGFFRAFWCASPETETGSPVIGYCSFGGSYRTIRRVAWESKHLYPDAKIYRNGREIEFK